MEVRLQEAMDLRYETIQKTRARVDLPEGMVDRLPPEFRLLQGRR
jgi:hypothetical protein